MKGLWDLLLRDGKGFGGIVNFQDFFKKALEPDDKGGVFFRCIHLRDRLDG